MKKEEVANIYISKSKKMLLCTEIFFVLAVVTFLAVKFTSLSNFLENSIIGGIVTIIILLVMLVLLAFSSCPGDSLAYYYLEKKYGQEMEKYFPGFHKKIRKGGIIIWIIRILGFIFIIPFLLNLFEITRINISLAYGSLFTAFLLVLILQNIRIKQMEEIASV